MGIRILAARFISSPDTNGCLDSWFPTSQLDNLKRHTELACAAATAPHPDTLYKMIGSKQVGKASVTGMCVLHHIRSCMGDRVAI